MTRHFSILFGLRDHPCIEAVSKVAGLSANKPDVKAKGAGHDD
jgi:hypothetical protein